MDGGGPDDPGDTTRSTHFLACEHHHARAHAGGGVQDPSARRYLKLGFGGVHMESNQRLMYTSAWASPQ